ncbi:hypothetical protein Lal_00000825 [Lupinus albus]|nr:hypothetical protein Lal_00000825 [Lupinus albus]
MSTSWMESNKKYVVARNLTHAQFVLKFVYITRSRCWKPRNQGVILSAIKGPSNYEDIRTVNNTIYPTFREACFDDREYIEAIKKANEWGSSHYLINLFVTMLTSNIINRPKHA